VDFDARQPHMLEPETDDRAGDARGEPASAGGVADPVADRREIVFAIAMTQAHRAEKFAVRVENRERELVAARPRGLTMTDPIDRVLLAVVGGAPRQPAADRFHRFTHGSEQGRCVAVAIRAGDRVAEVESDVSHAPFARLRTRRVARASLPSDASPS